MLENCKLHLEYKLGRASCTR